MTYKFTDEGVYDNTFKEPLSDFYALEYKGGNYLIPSNAISETVIMSVSDFKTSFPELDASAMELLSQDIVYST
jgi:hypothetical protein